MADPFTLPMIAANCAWGLISGPVGNRADGALVSGAKRLAAILARGTPEQNHHILRATQAAYVRAMAQMADSCRGTALSAEERTVADKLRTLVQDKAFAAFRYDGEQIPLVEVNVAIDRMFSGGISRLEGGGTVDDHHAFNRAVVDDLARWGIDLTEGQSRLFVEGVGEHAPWHIVLRIAFGEALIADPKARAIFTAERLGEIRGQGITLIDSVEAIHDRLDDIALGIEDLKRQIAEKRGVPIETMRAIAAGFGDEIQVNADLEAIERYLQEKANEYLRLKQKLTNFDDGSNYTQMLLRKAQEFIDRGAFSEVDTILRDAEEDDERISAELRASADRRDIDRSQKREMRAAAARLAGDYRAAVDLYHSAAEILPPAEKVSSFLLKYHAAALLLWWYDKEKVAQIKKEGREAIERLMSDVGSYFPVERHVAVRVKIATSLKEAGEAIWGEELIAAAIRILGSILYKYEQKPSPAERRFVYLEYAASLLRHAELKPSSASRSIKAINFHRKILSEENGGGLSDRDLLRTLHGLAGCLQLWADNFRNADSATESVEIFKSLMETYGGLGDYDAAIQCELNYGRSLLTKARILADPALASEAHEVLEAAFEDAHSFAPHLRLSAEKLVSEAYEYELGLAKG